MVQLKYRLIQALRLRTNIFWGLFFPIVLATLFHVAFSGILSAENFNPVRTAVVIRDSNEVFESMVKELDGDILDVSYMDGEEAEAALRDGTVSGIYYCAASPSLSVSGNGFDQTMLSGILQQYEEYVRIGTDIALTHPERMQTFFANLQNDTKQYMENASLGGKSYDATMEYFFALIAMACFFGCYTGQALGEQSAANVSPLAARRAVSPRGKAVTILTDLFVGFLIQFVSVLILLLYLNFALGVHVLAHPAQMILIVAFGSLLGVSFGIFIGCACRKAVTKLLLTTALPLLLCFFAGLMYGNMKQVIEANVPIVNRLNPAALISDAFYYLNVFDDPSAYLLRAGILGAYSAGITVLAIVMLRRERYVSI